MLENTFAAESTPLPCAPPISQFIEFAKSKFDNYINIRDKPILMVYEIDTLSATRRGIIQTAFA